MVDPVPKNLSPDAYTSFVRAFAGERTFLQSAPYGTFRSGVGEVIHFLGWEKEGKLIGVALVQEIRSKRGSFWHVPHGPLVMEAADLTPVLESLSNQAQNAGMDALRVSSLLPPEQKTVFASLGFQDAPVHLVNPERTWVLDITPTEEEILAQMKKTTRYEVRRIEKSGITVQMGRSQDDLDIFWNLHQQTVARQGFVPFPKANTEIELRAFGEDVQIFSAFVGEESPEGKPGCRAPEAPACPHEPHKGQQVQDAALASSIILFDDRAGYYHQGASQPSKLPVAYATLWAAIREAKRRGCREFNFWGVCAEEEKNHPWQGLSRFKRGFGGEERVFLHAQDKVFHPRYWVGYGIDRWRRWKRGY